MWPEDSPKPSTTTLYDWLTRATAKRYVSRIGDGTRRDPWRFRLNAEWEPFANTVSLG